VISAPLVFEYESVLLRQAAAFGLTARDIGDVLDYLCAVSHHQTIYYLWRPMLRDPGDDLVLEVAVAAESKYIVTHNLKDFAESRRFGIRAVTPGAFLKLIGEIHEHD
jgi:predicted nucleic acid-binding protein